MIRAAFLLVVAAVVAAWARPAGAQAVQCTVDQRPTTRVEFYTLPSGARNTFLGGGGITMRCPARGITLVADSIEQYGEEQRLFLLGNVRYTEPRLAVTADYITYFTGEERIVATGNVVATLPSGSTLRGPQAEYRRASPRVRPVAELESTGRPTITIVPEAAQGGGPRRNQDTTTVTGNRLFMRGDSLLFASGQVDIVRPDFGAVGDSVFMNTESQYMQLMRNPAIEGKGERPFRLTGDLIDLYSRERQLDRVVSRGRSRAVSEDMTLTADTIQFQVAQELLQAAQAWGRTRQAEALSPTQRITADSIAVEMPAQRVRRLAALGTAYAEAEPDTTQFRTTEKDWLRGDTIIARFDTLPLPGAAPAAPPAPDTVAQAGRASQPDTAATQIRELLAVGHARSYQHLPPQDTSLSCPAINYVRGDSILVTFDSGQVRTVRVINEASASGVLAEPDSTCGSATPSAPAGAPGASRPSAPSPDPAAPVDSRRAALPPSNRPQPTRP